MGWVKGVGSKHTENLDEIFQRLMEWGDEAVDISEESLTEALELVLREAKKRVPVRTGKLRDSLRIRKRRRGSTVMGTVGSSLDYAPPVEFGSRHFKSNVYIKPQPYLYPAIDDNRERIKEIFARNLRKTLNVGS